MKIFRIEHKRNGLGPYTADYIHFNHTTCNGHPGPYTDKNLKFEQIDYEAYFGFISIEQLVTWFSKKDMKKIARELDYQVIQYSVKTKYRNYSDTQAIFDKSKATIKKVWDIEEFYKKFYK